MTFERYIAVSQPLRASQICTIKRARYMLLFVLLIFFLINIHFLWTFHLSPNVSHCMPLNDQSIFLKYFTWFDSFKYSFCPFTLLITLNILIIKSLLNARNTNKLLEQQTSNVKKTINSKFSSISFSSTSTNNSGNPLIKKSKTHRYQHTPIKALAYRRVNRRLTTMLLTVSFAFCICSMPISIMQLVDAIYSDIEQRSTTMNIVITIGKIIAEISQYINHCKSFSFL
jgi:7 transmembrane receptor (rhodopsin family)